MQLSNRFPPPSCALASGVLAGLCHLLLNALEGMSFLSNELSQLCVENEHLRKDESRSAKQQARFIASLRGEVCFLLGVPTNRTATVPVKAAVALPVGENEPTGMLTFHRKCLTEPYEWSSSEHKLGNLFVSESGFIEREGQGMLQVDFANKFIGGGVLGGGCVQEEIRFMMCPELIVSRLFTEALGSREVLVITGAEQFNATCGYADKFTWKDDFKDDIPSKSFIPADLMPKEACEDQYWSAVTSCEDHTPRDALWQKEGSTLTAWATSDTG
ncbi:hypothetical protein HPB51_011443 [Rhipicephalus microplus]|uniref:PARG catalytic Macro domain-containing protein n=1 Tax=Rhipicephalus microplus TaxID=6941 RepID=A0A9J6EGL6_RHIMP|nr:hypothetical protein HPB51_011443 [Rhipicephalus microplus]